ncbi:MULTISPECIES: queuosine precursor transporter [unclassified Methanobrevibacter]|jgi:hypothetical protein|uniref:queuosine precursor transporter n=2 Tax=Methanobrevibacter TaxID=2172 RepID=UPI0039B90A23
MNLNTNFDYTDKKIIIITVFCVSFIIANVITVKILNLGFWGLDVPAGVLIYPLVYILTNVITEVYGEKAAHKTIVLGLLTNLLFVVVTTIAMIIPGPAYYTGQSSIEFVFTQTPRILLASYISYVIGNLVNARLTSIVNRGTNSKFTQIKNIGAIAFGELLDNIIFIGLVFIGQVPILEIGIMILVHFTIMLIWNVLAQPFTNRTVKWASAEDTTST